MPTRRIGLAVWRFHGPVNRSLVPLPGHRAHWARRKQPESSHVQAWRYRVADALIHLAGS
jgi:hypothetical protein